MTFDITAIPWFARQRRNHTRMRQVTTLMVDHYLRYPQTVAWVPAHQRMSLPRKQNGATS